MNNFLRASCNEAKNFSPLPKRYPKLLPLFSRYTGAAHISVHMVLLTRQTDSRYPAGNVSGLTMKLSRWGHGDVFVYKDKREGEESNAV